MEELIKSSSITPDCIISSVPWIALSLLKSLWRSFDLSLLGKLKLDIFVEIALRYTGVGMLLMYVNTSQYFGHHKRKWMILKRTYGGITTQTTTHGDYVKSGVII